MKKGQDGEKEEKQREGEAVENYIEKKQRQQKKRRQEKKKRKRKWKKPAIRGGNLEAICWGNL